MLKKLSKIFLQDSKTFILIFIGALTWALTMIKSGLVYSYGMGFWGPNGHDGVWHIALANGLTKGTWEMPIFAGENIKNYHIGFDLILAGIHKLTFISIHTLYFQILPPIFAILIGIYSYKFIYVWTKDKAKAYWGVFFIYFGGSWGWFVNLIKGQELGGETMFWSQQSISTLINPPYALSLIIIFAGLFYLQKGLERKSKSYLILATFLFGVLIQVKVYAGVLVLAGLLVGGILNLFKKKGLSLLKVFIGSLIVSILIFSPVSKGVGQTLIYKPLWFLETMMVFDDRLGWMRFGEAMINYKLGGVWIKALSAYGLALLIFVIGNLGTRIISSYWFWKKKLVLTNYRYMDVLVITIIATGIFIPLLFVQSGTAWNTIQFTYYSLLFVGILAGISMVDILRGLKLSMLKNRIIELILLILTIPTSLGTLYYHYLPLRPPAMISNAELEALNFLSKQPEGVVLTQPFDREKADTAINNPPRPLYLYESTAYVSAFSGKTTFLEDEVNLEITGYDWRNRRKGIESYLSGDESSKDFLKNNNITYLYLLKDLESEELYPDNNKGVIFENNEVKIYRVN